ncbi:hypothetical protein EGW08_009558, partial [Elysia chlorotica]
HLLILSEQLERIEDLLLRDSATHVQEVGWGAAVQMDDIHSRHGQASAVHWEEWDNVSIHTDVVEIVFGGFHLTRVTFSHVVHGKHWFLSELSIVIKVDFGVKTHN